MQRFKRIILPMQGHAKSDLHWLYNTRDDDEPPLIFQYDDLQFWFGGTSYRSSEKLLLYISVPAAPLLEGTPDAALDDTLPYESYLLEVISPMLAELSEEYQNTDKNVREKAQFAAQKPNENMLHRSGVWYDQDKDAFVLLLHFNVPLVNALSVNAKAAIRVVKDILKHVEDGAKKIDYKRLREYVDVYRAQQEIRVFMKEKGLCVFVGNGSILPREHGSNFPQQDAIPFVSPRELEVEIPLSDGRKLCGMGIRQGVTVITGGGYSGKSTLLDAIEMGIYNHIPGDGREYVITDESALKIYAEDGRQVSNVDISPFFKYLPGNADKKDFSTPRASGSVSQAASIVEAVYGESKLLLIDEDKSATNFMIRDRNMRLVVQREPIIPFTDRVRELYEVKGVSTVLVIGGSSEYLSCADTVILMEDYIAKDITLAIGSLGLSRKMLGDLSEPEKEGKPEVAEWQSTRRLIPKETTQPFLYFRSVETENEKKIVLDDYSADITLLTALISEGQLNMLAHVMERLLTDKEADTKELLEKGREHSRIKEKEGDRAFLEFPEAAQRFYEEIRPLDALCCIHRMTGVSFRGK